MADQIAGTQIDINLTLQDEDLSARDLTGATLYWRLTRHYSVPSVLNLDSVTNPTQVAITNPPGTDGLATVTLLPDDVLDLQGDYYHEIKAVYAGNVEKTWQLGTINFNESSVAGD